VLGVGRGSTWPCVFLCNIFAFPDGAASIHGSKSARSAHCASKLRRHPLHRHGCRPLSIGYPTACFIGGGTIPGSQTRRLFQRSPATVVAAAVKWSSRHFQAGGFLLRAAPACHLDRKPLHLWSSSMTSRRRLHA